MAEQSSIDGTIKDALQTTIRLTEESGRVVIRLDEASRMLLSALSELAEKSGSTLRNAESLRDRNDTVKESLAEVDAHTGKARELNDKAAGLIGAFKID